MFAALIALNQVFLTSHLLSFFETLPDGGDFLGRELTVTVAVRLRETLQNALLLLWRKVLGCCELRGGQEAAQESERLDSWFLEHQNGVSC